MFMEFYICLIAYLICSLNPSIIISNQIIRTDIRKMGSGNAGTTNILRTMGTKWGIIVFALDIIKVIISYLLILFLAIIFKVELTSGHKSLFVLASVLGHCYPFYYSFKGGKGIVVILTALMIADYKVTIFCLVVGVVIIAVTRIVSLGSIIGSILAVIIVVFMDTSLNPILIVITISIILYKHRENIRRVIQNKENKLFK